MRKICVTVIGGFLAFSAFGAGENVPTSKSYIDSELSQKQDTIERTTGNNKALTNTGTAGEYGTKDIYDSTGEYAAQQNALVDAQTMNTAVQNAINAEFVCISWVDDDPTKDCLLMEIRGVTGKSILPSGYTALEYIESTGTQYIDTGVPRSSRTFDLEVDVSFADTTGRYLIGTSRNSPGYCGRASDGKFEFQYSLRTSMSSGVNERVKMRYYGGPRFVHFTVTKNGISETLEFNNVSDSITTRTFVIYGNNRVENDIAQILNGKIYLAKVSIDNDLKRDLIPARRDSDNEIGMYDLVSNTFFTNAGTGEFIAGPVVNLYLPAGN